MSHTPPDASAEAKAHGTLLTAILAGAAVSVFIVIVLIAYQGGGSPTRATGEVDEADVWKTSTEGRQARLAELRGKEASQINAYGWVDQAGGVVRLPVDRAIELTITDLKAAQARK